MAWPWVRMWPPASSRSRANDHFRTPVTYTPPNPPIPGVWLPTAATPPIGTYMGLMVPFSLESADQFRPAGPPALDSKKWARDFNEVKAIGSRTTTDSHRGADVGGPVLG